MREVFFLSICVADSRRISTSMYFRKQGVTITDMVPSRRNITKAMAVMLAALKGKGKTIEVPELADRWSNLSDAHISDAGDSHSNIAPPCGT